MTDVPVLLFSPENYRSTDCVGYLLARVRTMLSRALDTALFEFGITHSQGSILWLLSSSEFTTAADLSRELHIDAASMTRMLDRLEKRKFIVRLPRGEDRRVVHLKLTQEGRALSDKFPGIYTSVLNGSFNRFSPEELGQLRVLLNKLLEKNG